MCTVKVHFSAREKIMQIGQNRPLENFTQFLFTRSKVACITNIWHDNIYVDTNLCDRHLTCIIRINKTCTEKCCFTVLAYCRATSNGVSPSSSFALTSQLVFVTIYCTTSSLPYLKWHEQRDIHVNHHNGSFNHILLGTILF